MAGPRVVEDLRAEHRSMGKLLELLEHQLELVAQDRGADSELVLQIAQYFASIPDLYHYPKEDVVLRRLAARHPEQTAPLSLLEADPNAEGFYRRMGARRVGETTYELDGRERILPLLALDMPPGNSPG